MFDDRFHVYIEEVEQNYYDGRFEKVLTTASGKTVEEVIQKLVEDLLQHAKEYLFANFKYEFEEPSRREEFPWLLKAYNLGNPEKIKEQMYVSILIAKNDEADFKIFAELNERDYLYERFSIFHKSCQYFRNWKSDSSFLPNLYYDDIDKDGKNEIVLICTLGHGTGVLTQEVHVLHEELFNDEDGEQIILTEKLIEDPMIAIHKSQMLKEIKTDELPYIGEAFTYEVVDHHLVARVIAQVGFIESVGEFIVTYKFADNVYQVESIDYESFRE